MATKAKSTKGIKFKLGNQDGPPETFTLIPEVKNFTAPGANASEIDATSFDSTSMEYIGGLTDGDTATLDMNHVPGSTVQQDLRESVGQTRNFQIDLNDGTTPTLIEFAAVITAVPGVSGGVNEVQTISGVSLRVTGDVTVTPAVP